MRPSSSTPPPIPMSACLLATKGSPQYTSLGCCFISSSSALLPSLQYQKMGFAARGNRVLKLVHPGGFVEIHTKPIMASEVMKTNPRHCVTRPDIFIFPWIVVSPDSLLRPGSVFFIVPCHTIRGLLKSRATNHTNNSFRRQGHTHNHRHQCRPDHRERFLQRYSNDSSIGDTNQHSKQHSCLFSLSCTPLGKLGRGRTGDYYGTEDGGASISDRDRGLSHSEQASKLKSCLKKDNNNGDSARLRNLKVRFACPDPPAGKTDSSLSS